MDHAGQAGMKHIPIARILGQFPQDGESRSATAAALAQFPRAGGVVHRKEAPAAPDIVSLAREEGRAEARTEYEALRKEDAERFAAQLASERQAWIDAESVKLGMQVEEGLRQVEQAIAAVAARLLKPVLCDHAATQAVTALASTLGQMLMERPAISLTISGPADLLERLRGRFANLPNATFTTSKSADICVTADQAVIETCLAPWAAKLGESDA
jgi:hypothetical protein